MTGLFATPEQMANACEQRASGVVRMRCLDFLVLTTESREEMDKIFAESTDLDDAQAAAYPMPDLTVDARGQVLQHNGRHRSAGAILRHGQEAVVDVALFLVNERRVPRAVQVAEWPEVLRGQYDRSVSYSLLGEQAVAAFFGGTC